MRSSWSSSDAALLYFNSFARGNGGSYDHTRLGSSYDCSSCLPARLQGACGVVGPHWWWAGACWVLALSIVFGGKACDPARAVLGTL